MTSLNFKFTFFVFWFLKYLPDDLNVPTTKLLPTIFFLNLIEKIVFQTVFWMQRSVYAVRFFGAMNFKVKLLLLMMAMDFSTNLHFITNLSNK